MAKLKNCPFCGTEALLNPTSGFPVLAFIDSAKVYCAHVKCGAEQERDTDEEAIAAWNRRAEEK